MKVLFIGVFFACAINKSLHSILYYVLITPKQSVFFDPSMSPLPKSLSIGLLALSLHTVVQADCIDDAAASKGVNSYVLRAIGWHESRLRSRAVSPVNRNNTRDYGAFQINDAVLREYGLSRQDALDGCRAAQIAANHLAVRVAMYGNTWKAVGAYHSNTEARSNWYANEIIKVLKKWQVLPSEYQELNGRMTSPSQRN